MTLDERIKMCCNLNEGSETDDCVSALCEVGRSLKGISEDFKGELCIMMAEELCREYVQLARSRQLDFDSYRDIPEDVYFHFSGGGARKLTETEYEDADGDK